MRLQFFAFKAGMLVTTMLLLSLTSFSQEKIDSLQPTTTTWSLQKCISYALENNLSIKSQAEGLTVQKNTLNASRYGLLPSIDVGGTQSVSNGRALDQTTYQFSNQTVKYTNASLSGSMILFAGFQKQNSIKKNNLDLMAGLQDFEKLKNDISLNIAAAYLQILFNQELTKVADDQLSLTKLQVDQTKKLVDAGKVVIGNLLDVQAQEASEELQLVDAQNNLYMSKLTLTQYLDLRDSVIEVSAPNLDSVLIVSVNVQSQDIYPIAEKSMPEIKSAEFRVESAQKSIDIAKGGYYPQLSLNVSYGSSYSDVREQVKLVNGVPITEKYPFFNQMKDNANLGVYLNLSIPIFSGFSNHYNTSSATANFQRAKINLDIEKNTLFKNIQQAYADAVASYRRYVSTKKSVATMQESYNYTQNRFNLGLINSIDYNTAKSKLTKAQSDLLQAKYEYIFKTKILDFYRGMPIKL
ncbi:MAG TPA: TolC family protein [Williamwhitmania sp.]|nr:TolC family protein [Williamwhitmania sp.]